MFKNEINESIKAIVSKEMMNITPFKKQLDIFNKRFNVYCFCVVFLSFFVLFELVELIIFLATFMNKLMNYITYV